MRNKFKNQKGVISVFAMLAMLFFLLFVIGAYMTISRKNKIQKQTNKELLELYSADTSPQSVYDSMVANPDEVVPIYSYDQLELANKDSTDIVLYAIDGKVYYFRPGMHYEVKSNISVPDRQSYKYENVYVGENKYVNRTSLRLQLDGENNSLTGHENGINAWKNLSSSGPTNASLYSSGSILASSGNWNENSIVLNGAGEYLSASGVLSNISNGFTLEMVLNPYSTEDQTLIGTAHGGLYIKNMGDGKPRLVGEIVLDNGNTSGDIFSYTSGAIMEQRKIQHVAISYNGKKISVYKNGEKIADNSSRFTELKNVSTISTVVKNIGNRPTPGTNPVEYRNYNAEVGFKTYLGKSDDLDVKSVITIDPYLIEGADNYPLLSRKTSTVYEDNTSNVPITGRFDYYREISSLSRKIPLIFKAKVYYHYQTDIDHELTCNSLFVGTNDNAADTSFSVMSVGTDSFILRSNVGKMDRWILNGNTVSPKQEVELLGVYYYAFNNLSPNTTYSVRGEYTSDTEFELNVSDSEVFIGRCFDGSGRTFGGMVHAVRVYNTALTEDNIKTNFNIDKAKYSIK